MSGLGGWGRGVARRPTRLNCPCARNRSVHHPPTPLVLHPVDPPAGPPTAGTAVIPWLQEGGRLPAQLPELAHVRGLIQRAELWIRQVGLGAGSRGRADLWIRQVGLGGGEQGEGGPLDLTGGAGVP